MGTAEISSYKLNLQYSKQKALLTANNIIHVITIHVVFYKIFLFNNSRGRVVKANVSVCEGSISHGWLARFFV